MNRDIQQLFDLSGRVGIVTGAGRGIGRELALGLAGAGMDIVAAARTLSEVEAVGAAVRRLGRQALPHFLDVTQPASIDALFQAAMARFGRVDLLVNCAGRVGLRSALEITEADWDGMVDTNLKGLFFCCQAAGRLMVQRRAGKIINIASTLGLVGLDARVAYCASKGGVVQLTRALAVEWAPYGVAVNALAPTTTVSGDTAALYADPDGYAAKIRDIPQQRLGAPADLVGGAIYLASAASDFVTGHVLVVDGGHSVH
jgi:2-deoxy-D-gluconate 3-dehydrogenase